MRLWPRKPLHVPKLNGLLGLNVALLVLAPRLCQSASLQYARQQHIKLLVKPSGHQLSTALLTLEQLEFGLESQADVPIDDMKSMVCFIKNELGSTFGEATRPKVVNRNASCAVVSSSGALNTHAFGKDIDAHDVVMRFNGAPTAGYESKVGSQTTMRVGWDFGHFAGDSRVSFYNVEPDVKQTSIGFMRHLYPRGRNFKAQTDWPTTGFYGMMLALFYCKSVDAYEMAPSLKARNSPYSYYRDTEHGMKANQNTWHGFFSAEHDLWTRLSTTSKAEIQSLGKAHYAGFSSIECN